MFDAYGNGQGDIPRCQGRPWVPRWGRGEAESPHALSQHGYEGAAGVTPGSSGLGARQRLSAGAPITSAVVFRIQTNSTGKWAHGCGFSRRLKQQRAETNYKSRHHCQGAKESESLLSDFSQLASHLKTAVFSLNYTRCLRAEHETRKNGLIITRMQTFSVLLI